VRNPYAATNLALCLNCSTLAASSRLRKGFFEILQAAVFSNVLKKALDGSDEVKIVGDDWLTLDKCLLQATRSGPT